MEHGEPPRIFSAEGRIREPVVDGVDPPPRRFPRFSPAPTVRRLRPHGLALVAAGMLATLALCGWIMILAWRGGRSYVHEQPAQQFDFGAITLKDEPPPWYRGGRRAFLERVRSESKFEHSFSVPDVDLKSLRLAFKSDAWVLEVGQVRKAPNEVVVPLKYRRPVAVGRFGADEGPVVDAEGVILPRADIDFDAAGPLVFLQDFPRPVNPQHGLKWHRLDSHGVPEADPQVVSACRLAGFLQEKLRREPPQPPRFFVFGDDRAGWIQAGEHHLFLWKDRLNSSPATALSDDEKWLLLIGHVRRCVPPPDTPHRLRFTRQGLEPVRFEKNP